MSDQSNSVTLESKRIDETAIRNLDSPKTLDVQRDLLDCYQQLPLVWDGGFAIDDTGTYDLLDIDSELSNNCGAILPGLPDCPRQDDSVGIQCLLQSCIDPNKIHAASTHASRGPKSDPTLAATTLGGSEPIRTCKVCGLTFANGYLLEDHARVEEHYTYSCESPGCGKAYRRRDVLHRHRATHDEPDFSCPFCSRSSRKRIFQRRDNLSQHVRTKHPDFYHSWKKNRPSPPTRRQTAIPSRSVDPSGCVSSHRRSMSAGDLPQSASADPITPDVSMIDQSCSSATDKVTSALSSILGNKDHIIVQVIQHRVDLSDQSVTEELARGVAELTLKEPEKLPETARAQLQELERQLF